MLTTLACTPKGKCRFLEFESIHGTVVYSGVARRRGEPGGASVASPNRLRKMKGRRMSYDGRVFTVQLGGVIRKLPLFEVAPGVKIAIFNMLGDTEVVETAAALLATRLPTGAEVLVVPEVKAVPLAHALVGRQQAALRGRAQGAQALHGELPRNRSAQHHHRRAADALRGWQGRPSGARQAGRPGGRCDQHRQHDSAGCAN
jgi:hypothetical protein